MKKKSLQVSITLLLGVVLFACSTGYNIPLNPENNLDETGYADPAGVFVLNEGNFGDEFGSLIYISPDHKATPMIYQEINNRPLGKVSQDMHFYDGRTYIISQIQNEETDGRLTVLSTKSLEKEANYSDELSELDAPSHIAVLNDNNIIIRDNKGAWRFDRIAKKLTFIMGSEKTNNSPMVKISERVFAAAGKKLLVFKADTGAAEVAGEYAAKITGLAPAGADALYVSTDDGILTKISTSDYSTIKANKLEESQQKLLSADWNSSSIAAKGDTIYFNGPKTVIYRHIFSTGTTQMMYDTNAVNPNHKVVYHRLAVHPVNGLVYMNTISDYATFKVNTIYEVETRGDKGNLLHRFDDLTHFPAGVFFPASQRNN